METIKDKIIKQIKNLQKPYVNVDKIINTKTEMEKLGISFY